MGFLGFARRKLQHGVLAPEQEVFVLSQALLSDNMPQGQVENFNPRDGSSDLPRLS
jgi:hypothetical protein